MDYLTLQGKGCSVSVIEASVSQITKKKLITFALTYWRPIHSEFMTHRDFSRNAQSSRAFPTIKLLEKVRTKPAGPIHWGKNQPGMQAHEECNALICDPHTGEMIDRETAWERAAIDAAGWAEAYADAGYHKQVVNRIIEPYSTITVLVTATEWDNWYALRAHADAQPEIQDLAYTMLDITKGSAIKYREVHSGDTRDTRTWHLPYVTLEERKNLAIIDALAASSARCARVSYLTHDRDNPSQEKDWSTYEKLVAAEPLHASPLEHQAHCADLDLPVRNFKGGWVQHRALLENAKTLDDFKARMMN
jgi:hypothetical protein